MSFVYMRPCLLMIRSLRGSDRIFLYFILLLYMFLFIFWLFHGLLPHPIPYAIGLTHDSTSKVHFTDHVVL